MDLELATIEQIVGELTRRYPGLVVLTQREALGEPDAFENRVFCNGGVALSIGMAECFIVSAKQAWAESRMTGGKGGEG